MLLCLGTNATGGGNGTGGSGTCTYSPLLVSPEELHVLAYVLFFHRLEFKRMQFVGSLGEAQLPKDVRAGAAVEQVQRE